MRILLAAGINTEKNNACLVNFYRSAIAFSKISKDNIFVFAPNCKKKDFSNKKTITVKNGFFHKKLPNSVNFFLNITSLIWHVRKNKIDVAIVRFNLLSFFLILSLRLFTKCYVITEHHGWIEEEISAKQFRLYEKFFRALQVFDAKYAHMVRVVVDGLKNKLIEYNITPDKIYVFPNGTDLDFFETYQNKLENNISKNTLHVGFLGNLVEWQGLETAIIAIKILKEKNEKVALSIFGEGPDKNNLEKLTTSLNLNDVITFHGEVAQQQVLEVLSTFDIAIAPYTKTRNQNLGISPVKIRDYAAFGLPIIASNVKGISGCDWLELFTPDDPQDLADTILRLEQNENLRHVYIKKSKEFAIKNFDLKNITEKFMIEIIKNKKIYDNAC